MVPCDINTPLGVFFVFIGGIIVVSIIKFLSVYYGMNLDAGVSFSHDDLKKNFDFIPRCSFEYASKHPEDVFKGKIIYVKDTFDYVIPYICPSEIISCNDVCQYTTSEDEDDKYDICSLAQEVENMSLYDIKKIMHEHKDDVKMYHILKNELIKRGVYKNKLYKIAKEIDREIVRDEIEECEFNDKYQRRRKISKKKS